MRIRIPLFTLISWGSDDLGSECIVEDNHHTGLGGQGGRGEDGEEDEEEDQPLGREETLSKDSAIDNRYDSDELSPTGQKDKLIREWTHSYRRVDTTI